MTMFYKLVMNGQASGQDIKNVFYYRTGPGVDIGVFDFAGAAALAGNFKQEVWSKIKELLTNEYQLETIDVSPINDEFQLVYQMPYSLAVSESGLYDGASYGPAACMNIKFVLEPTTILNGIKPPSRGYVALGPIGASMVDEAGYILTGQLTGPNMVNLLAAVAQNLEQVLPVPASWWPIRLKQSRILGGLIHWESFADIKGAVCSRRASFRRSRMPEA